MVREALAVVPLTPGGQVEYHVVSTAITSCSLSRGTSHWRPAVLGAFLHLNPTPPCSAMDTPTVKTSEALPRQAVSRPLGHPRGPGLSTAVGAQGSVCEKPGLRLVGTQGLGRLRGPPRLPFP